jgi:hypothetical protein
MNKKKNHLYYLFQNPNSSTPEFTKEELNRVHLINHIDQFIDDWMRLPSLFNIHARGTNKVPQELLIEIKHLQFALIEFVSTLSSNGNNPEKEEDTLLRELQLHINQLSSEPQLMQQLHNKPLPSKLLRQIQKTKQSMLNYYNHSKNIQP